MSYTLEQIEEAMEIAADMDSDMFVKDTSHRARYTKPRKAMFFLMVRQGYPRRDIAKHYGVGEGAVYHKRIEVDHISDPQIRRLIYDAERILKNG